MQSRVLTIYNPSYLGSLWGICKCLVIVAEFRPYTFICADASGQKETSLGVGPNPYTPKRLLRQLPCQSSDGPKIRIFRGVACHSLSPGDRNVQLEPNAERQPRDDRSRSGNISSTISTAPSFSWHSMGFSGLLEIPRVYSLADYRGSPPVSTAMQEPTWKRRMVSGLWTWCSLGLSLDSFARDHATGYQWWHTARVRCCLSAPVKSIGSLVYRRYRPGQQD